MIAADKLATFLSDLRSSGFTIGLPEHQRVIDLLLTLEIAGGPPPRSDRMCNMLAAILCRDTEQQAQFRRRFNNYFGEWRPGAEFRTPEPSLRDQTIDEEPGLWNALTAAERLMIRRMILLFLLAFLMPIIVPNLLVWMGLITIPIGTPSTGDIFALLQLLLLRVPGAVMRSVGHTLGAWTLFIAVPLFVVAGLWMVSPSWAFAAYLRRRRLDTRPKFIRLLLHSTAPNPFRDRQLYRDLQLLRRPRLVDSTELDIEASLVETLRYAGLFTPVWARHAVAPEHLFLIERRGENDHVARLADQLVTVLREAQVFVEVYWFVNDIRRLTRSDDMPALTFEEIAARHPDHRLVLVTSGECLFDPVRGAIRDWARLIRLFEKRVLLTPIAPALWGYREEALHAGLGIPVLRLHPASFHKAIAALLSEEPLMQPLVKGPPDPALARLADLLEERPMRWNEVWTPDSEHQNALGSALREGLGHDEHGWLAACAVYPELNWNLTLHIGNELFGNLPPDRLADRVLSLANLPWFRAGRMPIWLRQQLTESMPAELYSRVRHILSGLLLTVMRAAQRNLAFEVGLTREGAPFRESIDGLSSQMEDPILIDFMARRRRDRTSVRLPRLLARLVMGGFLHNVFSRDQIQDLEAAAEIVEQWVTERDVARAFVTRAPRALGPAFRVVKELQDDQGTVISMYEPLYLFLPVGKKPARLIEEASVALYHFRRRIAMMLSLSNTMVVLFAAAFLYGDYYQTAQFSLLLGVLWLAAPAFVLQSFLVWPVARKFATFPAFDPETLPGHMATRFIRRRIVRGNRPGGKSPAAT